MPSRLASSAPPAEARRERLPALLLSGALDRDIARLPLAVTVTAEMAKTTGRPRRALVEQVIPGLGAAQAGLQDGDVITGIAGGR